MARLLDLLHSEVEALDQSGSTNLTNLLQESQSFLSDLKLIESQLQDSDDMDIHTELENSSSKWYKKSISSLKSYNSQINKFHKNVVNSSKFKIDLDEAYSFPLLMNSLPVKEVKPIFEPGMSESELLAVQKLQNRDELMKSIMLHLLKIGQGAAVLELLPEFELTQKIHPDMLAQFVALNLMVDDVKVRHDLLKVLLWLDDKGTDAKYEEIAFKFHMLQFSILLAGNSECEFNIDLALAAYSYSKENFGRFFKNYLNEISPMMSLLLFKTPEHTSSEQFKKQIIHSFAQHTSGDKRHAKEARFIAEILDCFDDLHGHQMVFDTLANEFVAQYCGDMALSSESLLFQTMLAGFINLPNFHKYAKLQQRLGRKDEGSAPGADQELPFQLPDRNQFLFKYHPIFICPVLKEELTPNTAVAKITDEDMRDRKRKPIFVNGTEKLVAMANPVVVFDHCRHLALKDSVRHLSKGGSEMFKCHYCYKKHKLSDVSDAYFIDI